MKRLVAAALALGLAAVAVPAVAGADEYAPGTNLRAPTTMDDFRTARTVKRAGIAATVIGTGLLVSGAAVLGAAERGHGGDWTNANSGGTALLIAGGMGLTGGVPMWVVGARAERRDAIRINAGPTGVTGSF